MKNSILILALVLSTAIWSQQSKSRIITINGNDTTIIDLDPQIGQLDSIIESTMIKVFSDSTFSTLNQKFEIIIDTLITSNSIEFNSEDTTKLKFGNKRIMIIEDKQIDKKGDKDRRIIIDEDVTEDEKALDDEEDKPEENDFAHWAGIGIFSNGFLNSAGKVATKDDSYLIELDYTKSIGFNLNLLEKRFPVYKEYIGVTTGLGFQFNHYALKNNVDINVNKDSTFGTENILVDFRKNALRTTYLQAPLLLEFNTSSDPEKAWHLSAGVVGGIRIGSSWKTKWEDDGKTRKEKVRSHFNLNPFQAYATAIIGYHNVNLYVNYGLTQLFEKGKGPAFSPVNAGVLFNF
jgi:hypothetical protein